jgi:hypothetical protein
MSNSNVDRSFHAIDPETASATQYDAVIVGSGVSGAIVANELVQNNKNFKLLVLEAGPGDNLSIAGYDAYINRFTPRLSKGQTPPIGQIAMPKCPSKRISASFKMVEPMPPAILSNAARSSSTAPMPA